MSGFPVYTPPGRLRCDTRTLPRLVSESPVGRGPPRSGYGRNPDPYTLYESLPTSYKVLLSSFGPPCPPPSFTWVLRRSTPPPLPPDSVPPSSGHRLCGSRSTSRSQTRSISRYRRPNRGGREEVGGHVTRVFGEGSTSPVGRREPLFPGSEGSGWS